MILQLKISLSFYAVLCGDLKISPPIFFFLQNRPVVCSTNRTDGCLYLGVMFRVRLRSRDMSVNSPACTIQTSHAARLSSTQTRTGVFSALMTLTPYLKDWGLRVPKGDISMREDPVQRVRHFMHCKSEVLEVMGLIIFTCTYLEKCTNCNNFRLVQQITVTIYYQQTIESRIYYIQTPLWAWVAWWLGC